MDLRLFVDLRTLRLVLLAGFNAFNTERRETFVVRLLLRAMEIFLCLIFENEKIYLRPIDRESEFDFLESAPDGIDRVFTKDFVPFFPLNRFLMEFNLGAIRRPRAANSINWFNLEALFGVIR